MSTESLKDGYAGIIYSGPLPKLKNDLSLAERIGELLVERRNYFANFHEFWDKAESVALIVELSDKFIQELIDTPSAHSFVLQFYWHSLRLWRPGGYWNGTRTTELYEYRNLDALLHPILGRFITRPVMRKNFSMWSAKASLAILRRLEYPEGNVMLGAGTQVHKHSRMKTATELIGDTAAGRRAMVREFEGLRDCLHATIDYDIRELKAGSLSLWDARVRVKDRRHQMDEIDVRLKNYRHGVIKDEPEEPAN
jgi:phage baseplate assembly protein W